MKIDANSSDREKWNQIYSATARPDKFPEPCVVLNRYAYLLPHSGSALDVACGRGGNALFLSKAGLKTTAVDLSDNVIATLTSVADDAKLLLNGVAAAVEEWLDALDCSVRFDVIVVSRFLDRLLVPKLIDRLTDDGLVYYQTFIKEKALSSAGPSNPDFLLEPNELLEFFRELRIRAFYDPGTIGTLTEGLRNESYVVAQKMVTA